MKLLFQLLFLAKLFNGIVGHGMMVMPYTWFDHFKIGYVDNAGDCCAIGYDIPKELLGPSSDATGVTCMWFTNETYIPGEGTLPSYMRTFGLAHTDDEWDRYKKNPWRAPGTAPIYSPCGNGGGNPNGCGESMTECPGGGYPYGPNAEDFDFSKYFDPPVTNWTAGSEVDVAWHIRANHGGGYSYRLCKVPEEGISGLTEECFNAMHLDFVGDESWIQYGVEESTRISLRAVRTTEGTFPEGSKWTRSPVPACHTAGGGFAWVNGTNCGILGTQFPEVLKGVQGYGETIFDFFDNFDFFIIDKVKIPEDLEPGSYVLSFRWDCEQTPQVWNTCSSIDITN